MRGKRVGALLLAAAMAMSLLSGCGSGDEITEAMIPKVTDLRADETAQAKAVSLVMNKSYVAELTRLDGDNTQMASVDEKEIPVVLKATSMDKDLKVKIVNERNDKVITGTAFQVSVTDSANKTKEYTDSDKDGIIYIESMEPGKCTISMKSSGGYAAPRDITAEVKDHIEYKVVDIADEIKSESEINVAAEDSNTNGNADAGTAQVLQDTVEYVESSKTEITEEVKTQKVDQWGQLVFSKLMTDEFGTDMYEKILKEPTRFHKDENGDNKCDRCGADMTPAHTHSYTDTVTPPTCTEQGYTTHTCASCGNTYTDNYTEPNPDNHVDKNPADGVCDLCGKNLSGTETPDGSEGQQPSSGNEEGGSQETGGSEGQQTPSAEEGEGNGNEEGQETPGAAGSAPAGENAAGQETPGAADSTPAEENAAGAQAPMKAPAENQEAGTEAQSAEPETQSLDETGTIPVAGARIMGIQLLRTAPAEDPEKIVYDTTSRPIYNTDSEPVYEVTEEVTGYKYTGWQTIDGATYYFDKDGNKVTGSQIIQGIQYDFSDEGVRSGTIGIDVSKYQTNINWQKVKNAGINFVIIRCGYRGYGSGVLVQDPMFASHITGAKAAGLRVGIYFFSQAISEAEAVEEASMAVELANRYGINMPIAIDSEYANGGAGRADGLSKSDRTRITIAFCNTVANAGYKPMVYASKNWFSEHLNVSQFPGSYRIWVAQYASKCTYGGRYDIWQNTSKGSVDGVNGNVDMNISSI